MKSSPSYQERDKDVHPQRCPPHCCSVLYWRFCSGQLGNEEHARARTQVHVHAQVRTQVRTSTWTRTHAGACARLRTHAVEARRTHWAGRRLAPADHGGCGPRRVGSGSTRGTVSQRRPERQPGATVAPSPVCASLAFGNLEGSGRSGGPEDPVTPAPNICGGRARGVISPGPAWLSRPDGRGSRGRGQTGRAGHKSQPSGSAARRPGLSHRGAARHVAPAHVSSHGANYERCKSRGGRERHVIQLYCQDNLGKDNQAERLVSAGGWGRRWAGHKQPAAGAAVFSCFLSQTERYRQTSKYNDEQFHLTTPILPESEPPASDALGIAAHGRCPGAPLNVTTRHLR